MSKTVNNSYGIKKTAWGVLHTHTDTHTDTHTHTHTHICVCVSKILPNFLKLKKIK